MSILLRLIVGLSFIFPIRPSFAGLLEETTQQRAFLSDLEARATAVHDLNTLRLRFLHTCAQNMNDQDYQNAKVQIGEKREPWTNCEHGLAQVRDNTRLQYPRMRKNLLLSQLLSYEGLSLLLVNLESNLLRAARGQTLVGVKVEAKGSLFSNALLVDTPLATTLNRSKLPHPEWSVAELESAVAGGSRNFNTFFLEHCQQHPEFQKNDFCTNAVLSVDPNSRMLIFSLQAAKENLSVYKNQVAWARSLFVDLLRGEAKKIENEYFAMAQLNPYVVLVDSGRPSREQIIKAFELSLEQNRSAVREFERIKKSAQNSDQLKLMQYGPISAKLVSKPGPELERVQKLMPFTDLQAVHDELLSDYKTQELVRVGWTITKAMTANIFACWLPTTRVGGQVVLKLARLGELAALYRAGQAQNFLKTALTPLCYSVGGIVVGLGFLYESIHEYDLVYNQVFASVEEESLIKDLNTLSEKDREIFWSLITLPIGTGIFKYAKENASRLPSRLRTLIQKKRPEVLSPSSSAVFAPMGQQRRVKASV